MVKALVADIIEMRTAATESLIATILFMCRWWAEEVLRV